MAQPDPFPENMPRHSTTNVAQISRFCNNLIRSAMLSILAEKHNLFATYGEGKKIKRLGIPFFCGDNIYDTFVDVGEHNYFDILHRTEMIKSNINVGGAYYQTRANILLLYQYLHRDDIQRAIVAANPHKDRYNNNNDCYIHARLGDVIYLNAGIKYYEIVLGKLSPPPDNIFISSDTIEHEICQILISKYGAIVVDGDEVETIQFATTCKYMILSNGTFSSVMGYLNYTDGAEIYYPEVRENWHGDIFCIEGWNKIAAADYAPNCPRPVRGVPPPYCKMITPNL